MAIEGHVTCVSRMLLSAGPGIIRYDEVCHREMCVKL